MDFAQLRCFKVLAYDFYVKLSILLVFFLFFSFSAEDRPVMDWATRVKVAAGAARGIAYLHEDCNISLYLFLILSFHISC